MAFNKDTMHRRLVVVIACIALIAIAFLRGYYLLGFGRGIIYVLLTSALIWLILRSFARKGKASRIQAVVFLILSVPVGLIMAFPATFDPDVPILIAGRAENRNVRTELKSVFDSDVAFSGLSISTKRRKALYVTVHGRLSTHVDHERLRHRILTECPTLGRCGLCWDICIE